MTRTVARLLAESLEAHDVDQVFCVPGESYIGLTNALADMNSIRVVVCRHEGGAGHTVTIQRNGRTYVFTTDKELTAAEIDARIARVDAEVAGLPPLPAKPDGTTTVTVRRN